MENKKAYEEDIIDKDLYEDIDDEEMYQLVQAARQKILTKEKEAHESKQNKRRFPRWAFWLIALAMLFQVLAFFPQTFSIPAIDFLKTSASLSQQADIKLYKQAVVVIETDDSRGTGFSISEDGLILTNHHVVEENDNVTVAFPNEGLFRANVIASYPSIDVAVLATVLEDDQTLPFLSLADHMSATESEVVRVIGNPLGFRGIANEGTVIDRIRLSSWDEDVMMIKAPIYRGSSGSPIINQDGEVIGIVFATLHHEDHGRVGLFIPIDYYYEYEQND